MPQNFKIVVEYDGTDLHGWQRQKNESTVQGQIEKALSTMTQQDVAVVGSGRTDAGVHAIGQVAHFKCDTRLTAEEFLNGLNSLLPPPIAVMACQKVDDGFHARYDVKKKRYQYRIVNRPQPTAIYRQYHWHIRRALQVEAMQQATRFLVGRHDFGAFEGTGSPRSHRIRNVFNAGWQRRHRQRLDFDIEADGFLRYMVRSLVGTLVEVGLGKISVVAFQEILDSKDRSRAGPTAPPQGLFLMKVEY